MKKMLLKGLTLCLMMACSSQAHAQLSNLINKVTSAATGNTAVSETTLANAWTYSGSAVEFESSDVLKNLGGSAASATIEKKIDAKLATVGVSKGKIKITFKSDKSFTATMNGKSKTGTYTLSGKKLNLKFSTVGKGINCTTQMSGSNLELLFTADKVMSFLTAMGSKAGSSSLSSLSSLLGSYDGMNVGLKFSK